MSNELCKCGKVGIISCPNDERCGKPINQLPADVQERIKADAEAMTNETGRVFINKILLLAAGFKEKNNENGDFFVKDKVEVWDFNGEYWIVDILDQAGIEKEFQYMDELETLFKSFGLTFYKNE